MAEIILSNAFSLNMLQIRDGEASIRIKRISLEEAKNILSNGFTSAIGHQSTAQILTQLLGISVPLNRIEIKLMTNQKLVVFQLNIRLNEGQVLSNLELQQLYLQGKVGFYLVELVS